MATIALASASCADYLTVTAKTLQARSGMYPCTHWLVARSRQQPKVGRMRDLAIERDPAKPPPGDRVGHFLAQALIAQPVTELKKHQPQIALHRGRRPADHRVEIRRERREKRRVITASDHGPPREFFREKYLGDEPLPVMKMIEECAPSEPALKSAYQLLSGVAHGLWHGHARLLQPSESEIPGTVGLGLAVGAQTLARDLAAAPLCACALVGRLGWYTGWNLDALMVSINYLSANWERVAGMG